MNWKSTYHVLAFIGAALLGLSTYYVIQTAIVAPDLATALCTSLPLAFMVLVGATVLVLAYMDDLPSLPATYAPSPLDVLWRVEVMVRLMPKWRDGIGIRCRMAQGYHYGTHYLNDWRHDLKRMNPSARLTPAAAIVQDRDYW